MHFEMNEAWILSDAKGEVNHSVAGSNSRVQSHTERYSNGKTKVQWSTRIAGNGRLVRHGSETWFYADGKKKYEVSYEDGRKVGRETFRDSAGNVKWEWNRVVDRNGDSELRAQSDVKEHMDDILAKRPKEDPVKLDILQGRWSDCALGSSGKDAPPIQVQRRCPR